MLCLFYVSKYAPSAINIHYLYHYDNRPILRGVHILQDESRQWGVEFDIDSVGVDEYFVHLNIIFTKRGSEKAIKKIQKLLSRRLGEAHVFMRKTEQGVYRMQFGYDAVMADKREWW